MYIHYHANGNNAIIRYSQYFVIYTINIKSKIRVFTVVQYMIPEQEDLEGWNDINGCWNLSQREEREGGQIIRKNEANKSIYGHVMWFYSHNSTKHIPIILRCIGDVQSVVNYVVAMVTDGLLCKKKMFFFGGQCKIILHRLLYIDHRAIFGVYIDHGPFLKL